MGDGKDNVGDAAYRFVEANSQRHDFANDNDDYRRLTLDMWGATRDAIIQAQNGHPLDPELGSWLVQSIDEVLDNRVPLEIVCVVKPPRGAPSDSPGIVEAKRYAILYKQAVVAGDIIDKSPTKTIAEKYDCTHQTVRDWAKQYPLVHWDEYTPDRTLDQRIDSFMRLFERSALHFQEHSRSHNSVKLRDKKRQLK